MSPSAWKLGLPLSVKVRSDIYKPLRKGGREREVRKLILDRFTHIIFRSWFIYVNSNTNEISGLGHHPFLLLWTTEVKSTIQGFATDPIFGRVVARTIVDHSNTAHFQLVRNIQILQNLAQCWLRQ